MVVGCATCLSYYQSLCHLRWHDRAWGCICARCCTCCCADTKSSGSVPLCVADAMWTTCCSTQALCTNHTPAQVSVLWDQRAPYKGFFLRKMHNLGSGATQCLVATQCHGLQAVVLDGKQPAIKLEVPVKKVLRRYDRRTRLLHSLTHTHDQPASTSIPVLHGHTEIEAVDHA